jgi:hypothetical protein
VPTCHYHGNWSLKTSISTVRIMLTHVKLGKENQFYQQKEFKFAHSCVPT